MAITIDDFSKIWASTSPLTPYSFSESQYKEGWNFIGSTPPARQMWDFLQKNNDEKMQYLLNNFDNYLPLSGGTLTGDVDITGDLSVSGAIYSSDPASGENSGQVPTTAWVQKLVAEALKLGVLPGTVTAFSGTFKDGYPVNKNTGLVDKEWHLCDGTNGTPDLRNRFIYGGDGTNNGATGGEASHKLTEAELPALSGEAGRYMRWNIDQVASGILKQSYNGEIKFPSANAENAVGSVVKIAFGGDQPHNNMPPYYVLAYIVKL